MIQTVNQLAFRDAFNVLRPDNFSYSGLGVLFDYIEEYEESSGQQLELDVTALCCEYNEGSPDEIASYYDIDTEGLDEEELAEAVMDYLNYNTIVCGVTAHGTIVYCSAF